MTAFRLTTVITLFFTLVVPCSADASLIFTPADLTGNWEMNRLGSPGPWWARGRYNISGVGTFSNVSVYGSNKLNTTESGTFAIADDGIITEPGSAFTPSFKCAMDSGKRIAACTNTTATGEADLHLFSRKASVYSQADLAATWEVNGMVSGPGAPWWAHGSVNIHSNGSFDGILEFPDDEPEYPSAPAGTFMLGTDGVLTSSAVDPDFRSVMDSGKTILVGTSTWDSGAPGSTEMTVWTKKADSYSLADLTGTWWANELGTPGASCARGPVTIDENGVISGTVEKCDNTFESKTGTFSVNGNVITLSGTNMPSTRCSMDKGKDFVVCAYINNSSKGKLLILTSYGGRTLTVTRSGSGTGTVTADSGTLTWNGDTGMASYMTGVQVILTASPDPFYTFSGWAGDCTPSGASCTANMTTNREVTALFSLTAPKAKIGTTGYISLNAAYTAASTPGPTTILALDAELTENLSIGSGKQINLVGGYNAAFNGRTGNPTMLKGILTIATGSLTVDGLAVR